MQTTTTITNGNTIATLYINDDSVAVKMQEAEGFNRRAWVGFQAAMFNAAALITLDPANPGWAVEVDGRGLRVESIAGQGAKMAPVVERAITKAIATIAPTAAPAPARKAPARKARKA